MPASCARDLAGEVLFITNDDGFRRVAELLVQVPA
jgi:hypothetical protein